MQISLESRRRTASPSARPGEGPAGLPFGHLNLRRNPFGELDPSERAGLAVVNVDRFVQRLKQPGYAVQFIGRQGRGKTTHLLAILRRFPRAAYLHVCEGGRPRIPPGQPLLIDEMQRLAPRRRRRLYRRPVSLALGTHDDLAGELARWGFEVETVRLSGSLDAGRLHEILNRRVAWARRGPGPLPRVRLQTAHAMLGRFGDDVRAIQRHLYNRFQDLPEIQDL